MAARRTRKPCASDDARDVLSVGALCRRLQAMVESAFPKVWVQGEVASFSRAFSGHCYLTLKDDTGASLNAVIWRSVADRMKWLPQAGDQVLAAGSVTVYTPRSSYQLTISALEPHGKGALQAAFERLKAKLHAEGVFDPARKRAIPRFPRLIGVVTSLSGAALRDVLSVAWRRHPRMNFLVAPASVQGEEAPRAIAQALAFLHHADPAPDVILVTRGGGAPEDLHAFNDEIVARALAAATIPTVSAVGHEIDTTIADFVADLRAPTPSAAAELIVPDLNALLERLETTAEDLASAAFERCRKLGAQVRDHARRLAARRPDRVVRERWQRLDELAGRLQRAPRRLMRQRRREWQHAGARLHALSPLSVLARGFSLTTRETDRAPLTDAALLAPGDLVRTRLSRGAFTAQVRGIHPDQDAERP